MSQGESSPVLPPLASVFGQITNEQMIANMLMESCPAKTVLSSGAGRSTIYKLDMRICNGRSIWNVYVKCRLECEYG